MNYSQTYVSNLQRGTSAVDIVNVYNTHTYGDYLKYILPDPRDMHCLFTTISGQGQVILKDKTVYNIEPKTIYIGTLNNMRCIKSTCDDWHFLLYWFIPNNIKLPANQLITIKDLDIESMEQQGNKIINLMQTYVESKIFYCNALFYCSLYNILESITPYVQRHDKIIQRMIDYINVNIESPIQVSDLSSEFGYCEKHIRYLFKISIKQSPKQYIEKAKIKHVANLLIETNESIQDIADKCSFSSINHLCNNFKKEYSISPSEYRKKASTFLLE